MKLGRYELMGKIGEGAHGVVYLANDPKLGREVAIKALQPDMAADEGVQMRFRREMKSCARLKHPNIVELVDFSDPDAEWPYLVMERLHGETLYDLVTRTERPLSIVAAAAAAHEICLALDHAHSQGIVHRDLKPENVFLEPSGRVVLCDFGIAVGFFGEEDTLAGKNTKLLGSPLYMAPEQILADAMVGPQSDLFALGSLLYYLVTGEHAFAEQSILGVLKRISTGAYNPLPDTVATTRLGGIIAGLLQPDTKKRYASAELVVEELLVVMSEAGHVDPRRALKNTLSVLATDKHASESQITAMEDLDRESRTMISKVVEGKPDDWREVTDSGGTTKNTTIVNLNELRNVDTATHETRGESTQIHTVGRATAKPPPGETRSQIVTLVAGVVLIAALGTGAIVVFRPKKKPLPPPVVIADQLPNTPPPPISDTLPTPPKVEAPPTVPDFVEDPPDHSGKPRPPKPRDPPPQKPDPPKEAKVEPVIVRIIAKPWAYVSIDGKPAGQTPTFREATLTPGKHTLRFENPDFKPLTRVVDIKADGEKIKVDLENPD